MKRNRWPRNPVLGVLVLLLSALLAGCGASSPSSPDMSSGDRVVQQEGSGVPAKDGEDDGGDGGRLIIRSKVLRLEVDSTPDAIGQIRDLTRTHSGTVTDMQVATDSDEWVHHYDENGYPVGDGTALRGWVTVRVPTGSYEDFVEDVAGIGVVKYQAEATEDVTQQHVDLSARLENLRAQEVRLREFFDAAENVTEMLAIEEELGRVRGEIESLDAQVTYLERQAAMATVTIELTEPRAVVRPDGDSWGFVAAITSGIRGAAALLTGAVTALIATSPLWVAGLILFFPIRAFVRRRRAGASGSVTPTAPASPIPAPEPEAAAVPETPTSEA